MGPFTYTVPAALREQIRPGQIVWVPFRQGQQPGIVVALSSERPAIPLKAVAAIVDPRPVLTETQLALGRRMAEYYLCSLADALLAMLPPGLLHGVHTRIRPTAEGRTRPLTDLPPPARRVVEALRTTERGRTVAALAQSVGRRGLQRTLEQLVREGWATRETVIAPPAARPHREPFLALTAPPEEVARQRQRFWAGRRNSAAARVLETLARAVGGSRTLASLRREYRVDRRTLRALEADGLVRVEEEVHLLRLTASEERWDEFFERKAARAPRQAVLLQELLEAGGEVDLATVEAPAEVRRALQRQGLLQEEPRPARVRLTVLPQVAEEQAAALRRTPADERLLHLLDLLEDSPDRARPLSELTRQVRGAGRQEFQELLTAGIARVEQRQVYRDPLAGQEVSPEPPPPLTGRQGKVWREVYEVFRQGGGQTFLLHGVTGSGKTEIYLRALARALRDGRQAIVLVPEISLTPQTVRRFLARFPGRVAVLHSGLSVGERYDQWRRARNGEVDVVIGPRSALFAPLPHLGLIVVDEEQDDSYKQTDPPPRYHARETALFLAQISGSVVILGGATPAVVSYYRAAQGRFRLLELPDRIRVEETADGRRRVLVDRSMPRAEIVDMRAELRAGNRSIFSRSLQQALREVLAAGEQAILFLNRRGMATFVLCRSCGHVLRCPRCEVAYVYHSDRARLLCHRCGRERAMPTTCPACGSRTIRYFGVGTERVEQEVRRLLPAARVLRWDRDAARAGRDDAAILDALLDGRVDFLVGTQVLAKGLDLPRVTLVGVVSADTALHLPDIRSAERTFQLLAQVIGRAGRRAERGRAIIQTYHPEHYAIRAAAAQDYRAFFRQEIAYRREHGYPPFLQLAGLTFQHRQEAACREEAGRVATALRRRAQAVPGARVIGPAPAFVPRARGRYRWQVLLLAPRVQPLLKALSLGRGWQVDVDPVSLL